ncbi:sporulation protein YjcZ [Brevibacillus brevis]
MPKFFAYCDIALTSLRNLNSLSLRFFLILFKGGISMGFFDDNFALVLVLFVLLTIVACSCDEC